jgi:hypothetical protein
MLLHQKDFTLDCITFRHVYNSEVPVTFTEYNGHSVCMHETVLECMDSFMKFYIGNFCKRKSLLLTVFCEILHAFMREYQAEIAPNICWRETSFEQSYREK